VILVRGGHVGQEVVGMRRQQVRLVLEVVIGVVTFLLFSAVFVVTIYVDVNPGAGTPSVALPLEATLGHGGALVFMLVASALLAVGGLLSALGAIRSLRSKRYLAERQPTYEDFM
jgi:hypothetical protein